tara:strand:- start:268 stop:1452 length:1185 start_codon:yes stop_codon:yes gene_type:complete
MAYDFHKLKTVSVADGAVTLRIPERWDVVPHERDEGRWGCYEEEVEGEDTDTGTLWIGIQHFQYNCESVGDQQDTRMMAEQFSQRREPNDPPYLENVVQPVDQGHRWFRMFDGEEDGDRLRFWFSHLFLKRGDHVAIAHFNFVLPHYRMDDPEFVELREIMEREIEAAFLDPFRKDEIEEIEQLFGPLQICNFDNQVKIELPEAMGCWPHGGDDDPPDKCWYCRLDIGTSHAGMFVYADDLNFAFEEDGPQMGEPSGEGGDKETQGADDEISREILEHVFQKVVSEWTGVPEDIPRNIRMPWGIVHYEVTDDQDSGDVSDDTDADAADENRPLRNHLWKLLCHDGLRNRRVQVLLMTAIADANKPPYAALAAYMQRAVRRAEFPGFPAPERYPA